MHGRKITKDLRLKLTHLKINTKEDAIKATEKIPCNSLITGGHLDGINTMRINGEITIEKQELIESNNLHGTGCNLSSAIVANLENGNNLVNSCLKSFDYVYEAIKNGNYGTLIAKM